MKGSSHENKQVKKAREEETSKAEKLALLASNKAQGREIKLLESFLESKTEDSNCLK